MSRAGAGVTHGGEQAQVARARGRAVPGRCAVPGVPARTGTPWVTAISGPREHEPAREPREHRPASGRGPASDRGRPVIRPPRGRVSFATGARRGRARWSGGSCGPGPTRVGGSGPRCWLSRS